MQAKKEISVTVGDHIINVLVTESATSAEQARAIVEAINNDPDCPAVVFIDDEGSIRQKPVEVFELRCPEMETLENFKLRHGLSEKKGRRRGQRKLNFPK